MLRGRQARSDEARTKIKEGRCSQVQKRLLYVDGGEERGELKRGKKPKANEAEVGIQISLWADQGLKSQGIFERLAGGVPHEETKGEL